MRCSEYVSVPVRRAAVARLASMPMSIDSCRLGRDSDQGQARQEQSLDQSPHYQKNGTVPQKYRPATAANVQVDKTGFLKPAGSILHQGTQATR